jgi:hypothetical protein
MPIPSCSRVSTETIRSQDWVLVCASSRAAMLMLSPIAVSSGVFGGPMVPTMASPP